MITTQQYVTAADFLRCEPEMIMAVAAVESSGAGFFADGSLKILFEPHIFWQQLVEAGVDPRKHVAKNADILYPKWKPGAYGPSSKQWSRLNRAAQIHKISAYESASWGKFQPLGRYHEECGFKGVMEMFTVFMLGEHEHLNAFVKMIKARGLDVYLRQRRYADFARRYNGSGYAAAPGRLNDYDYKIEQMFLKLKQQSKKLLS